MLTLKSNRKRELLIQISLIVLTVLLIIVRFLLNEKGRVSPDSVRFMRSSHVFPTIDNTTTPLGYPLSIKLFTFIGFDEFWASKVIGILAYLFVVWFAWKKQFYFKEIVLIGGIFSFVSLYAATLSEPFFLPFIFMFLYISRNVIIEKLSGTKALLFLSLLLIIMYNIRYSALFFMGGSFLFGLFNFKKKYGKTFIISSLIGLVFVVLYKFLFIDVFNKNYVNQFLEIGLHPTSKLLKEFFFGLCTSFNPLIHMANPAGGKINFVIYGIGFLNIALMVFLFIKNKLSETEKFFVWIGFFGIICSYLIQYVYSIDALDFRLLSPFTFPIWLVYFKKLYQIFGKLTYGITYASLAVGLVFTWLSKGNYLENRKEINTFLSAENFKNIPLKFYAPSEDDLDKVQLMELVSTVNSNVNLTTKPKDTLQKTTLTEYKVLQKIKISKNKYQ